jgi:hypothetical protein
MENKVVTLKIESNLNSITKDVKKLGNTFEDTADEIKGIQQSTKSAESGVKSLSDGFKGMGLAIKAIGIGLVMEAFNLFKEVLGKNQKVVDTFNTVIGALSIAFNDLFGFVMDNFPSVIKIFKDVFENPTKYLQKFGDLVKENLIERFNSFLDTLGFVSEAIKKVFEGDFSGAMDSVKKAGKESLDVLTGVNDSFDKGKKIVGDAAEAIGNYAVKTFKASEANIKLQNSALIAAAEQAKLVEQYDRQAESQRQIRDNDLLSISDRIKANDKLKTILEKQEAAMLKAANLQKDAAAATYNLNKTTENRVALINAEANVEGVLAQIKGLKSEQLANENSLTKESNDLLQSQIDTKNELNVKSKQFDSEQELTEIKKLEKQREVITLQQEIDNAELLRKRKLYADGTQARVDAENEFLIKKQETDNALVTNQSETNKRVIENDKAVAEAKKGIQEATFNNISSGIGLLKGLFEKNKGLQKALLIAESAAGIAKIIINTKAANAAAKLKYALLPGGIALAAAEATMNNVSAGIGIASTIAATAKGLSAMGGGGSGGGTSVGGDGGGGGAPAAPSFNVVGASSTNQLAQTIGSQQQQPIKAYVVANDVTTQQGLDRNIVQSASIG